MRRRRSSRPIVHGPPARRARLRRCRDGRRARDEGGQCDRRRRGGGGARARAPASTRCASGHDLTRTQSAQIRAALVARVPEERLREAAGRIARTRRLGAPGRRRRRPRGGVSMRRGARSTSKETSALESARSSSSCVRRRTSPPARQSIRLPRRVVREGEPVPAADVFVVRDAHRHPWMQEAADIPGAVVVETGLPVWRPSRSRGYVATNGGSRASLRGRGRAARFGGDVSSHLEAELREQPEALREPDRAAARLRRADPRRSSAATTCSTS